jgi:ADP-ribosylglycohydrolase
MKHPNDLMLVRIAQGDAYGMACEYIKFPRDQAVLDEALRFERYGRHPTHKLEPGQYTDDTQMSIAVSEVLLAMGPDWKSSFRVAEGADDLRAQFADSFVACFKRDQRDGYARGFQALLEQVTDGRDLLAKINPDSDKNGACMRAVPIGVLPDPEDVVAVAGIQARITHDTVGGQQSAILVAMMSHFALHCRAPFKDFPAWSAQYINVVPHDHDGPVVGPGVGLVTADAVFTLLDTETTLWGIARRALMWGGDTDSVLAIAWGIASARMSEDLPPFFDGGLENGPYGRTFLADLGKKLMVKYHQ